MAYPSRTKDRSCPRSGSGGFTLVEIMMVTLISAFVFAGVLSAYIFLGRGLMRQANEEVLESRSRLALYYLTQDVSAATAVTAENPGTRVTGTQMTLTTPTSSSIVYSCDWSGGTSNGILNRQVGSGPVLKLLTNLTSISFGYYDITGSSVSVPTSAPTYKQFNIKQINLSFTSTAGYANSGAQSNLTVVSPRILMKNKSVLEDPNDTN
jgi:Tfp pilus assembly protein PilW